MLQGLRAGEVLSFIATNSDTSSSKRKLLCSGHTGKAGQASAVCVRDRGQGQSGTESLELLQWGMAGGP